MFSIKSDRTLQRKDGVILYPNSRCRLFIEQYVDNMVPQSLLSIFIISLTDGPTVKASNAYQGTKNIKTDPWRALEKPRVNFLWSCLCGNERVKILLLKISFSIHFPIFILPSLAFHFFTAL